MPAESTIPTADIRPRDGARIFAGSHRRSLRACGTFNHWLVIVLQVCGDRLKVRRRDRRALPEWIDRAQVVRAWRRLRR